MEIEDIVEYLRTHMSISVSMDSEFEEDRRYVTCSVSITIDGEEVASDYSSINVS